MIVLLGSEECGGNSTTNQGMLINGCHWYRHGLVLRMGICTMGEILADVSGVMHFLTLQVRMKINVVEILLYTSMCPIQGRYNIMSDI